MPASHQRRLGRTLSGRLFQLSKSIPAVSQVTSAPTKIAVRGSNDQATEALGVNTSESKQIARQ